MNLLHPCHARSGAFTLLEVMIAAGLFSLVAMAMMVAYSGATLRARAGSSQAYFVSQARLAELKFTKYIQMGQSVSVTSNANQAGSAYGSQLNILMRNGQMSYVYYFTNAALSNCYFQYFYPSNNTAERILTGFVTPITNAPIFSIMALSPNAAFIQFHLGDSTNASDAFIYTGGANGTGPGFQGVEVRFAATPRNIDQFLQ